FFISYMHLLIVSHSFLFLFLAPSPTEIYTLSLHDALPISRARDTTNANSASTGNDNEFQFNESDDEELNELINDVFGRNEPEVLDRKSTRLNSSHVSISYAVFCLK